MMNLNAIKPIRTETPGPIILAGCYERYTEPGSADISKLWGRFTQIADPLPHAFGEVYYGLVWDAFTKGQYFEYMASLQVGSPDGLPAEFTVKEISAQIYAVFEHIGPLSELCNTLDAIFKTWLPENSPEAERFPSQLEVYGEDFDPAAASTRLEIWVPLA